MHAPGERVRSRGSEAEANQRIYLSEYLMDLDHITVNTSQLCPLVEDAC